MSRRKVIDYTKLPSAVEQKYRRFYLRSRNRRALFLANLSLPAFELVFRIGWIVFSVEDGKIELNFTWANPTGDSGVRVGKTKF